MNIIKNIWKNSLTVALILNSCILINTLQAQEEVEEKFMTTCGYFKELPPDLQKRVELTPPVSLPKFPPRVFHFPSFFKVDPSMV